MTDRFEDNRVDREGLLSLGIDRESGEPYLSIPVANRMVDYEEYYRLSSAEYRAFEDDPAQARVFADACRAHAHDDRLILQPGADRGTPLTR
jgi:hypothetical protein